MSTDQAIFGRDQSVCGGPRNEALCQKIKNRDI